jgi:metal-responsive CopG/Arc/MetJ family transcriptional regulator
MSSVRINISLPEELVHELTREIEPRGKSRFIAKAIRYSLKEEREKKLAAEYQEAAAEVRRVNQDLEGVLSDGLDSTGRYFIIQF